jgi:hypothetical protein
VCWLKASSWIDSKQCLAVSLRVVIVLSVQRLEKENARKSRRVEISEAEECRAVSGCRGCGGHIWRFPVTKQDIATAVNGRKLEDNGIAVCRTMRSEISDCSLNTMLVVAQRQSREIVFVDED